MPLHDRNSLESVLVDNNDHNPSLVSRVNKVRQDLSNWQFYVNQQCIRLQTESKFKLKYDAFLRIGRDIEQIIVGLNQLKQDSLVRQVVEDFESQAAAIYDRIADVASMHRDRGLKGALKVTFFRQPQSAQDFDLFESPIYRK